MNDVPHQQLIDFLTAAVLSHKLPKTHADLIIAATRERWEGEDWMDEVIIGAVRDYYSLERIMEPTLIDAYSVLDGISGHR